MFTSFTPVRLKPLKFQIAIPSRAYNPPRSNVMTPDVTGIAPPLTKVVSAPALPCKAAVV
jgi:hypothetical protein